MNLTDEQVEAVEAERSAQLLVAGAGTGKTTVMARRILHLVESGQARADQVLGLTFTNKAAAHLKAKVWEQLGADADVTVGTYHSFGASLVADHALELDLHPDTASSTGPRPGSCSTACSTSSASSTGARSTPRCFSTRR